VENRLEKTFRVSMAALPTAIDCRQEPGPSHHTGRAKPRADLYLLPSEPALDLDHFVERDGVRFAGTHLIVDFWRALSLDNINVVETALRDAAEAAGATLLSIDLHCFTPNGGITGVALLAESHISIHTWPERAYAAVDVFMCGDAEPHKAIDVLRGAFSPQTLTISEQKRGVVP
jgi:S-adenosylmethionine decarboxylase